MKKLFLSFTIGAAALTMVSCGNAEEMIAKEQEALKALAQEQIDEMIATADSICAAKVEAAASEQIAAESASKSSATPKKKMDIDMKKIINKEDDGKRLRLNKKGDGVDEKKRINLNKKGG